MFWEPLGDATKTHAMVTTGSKTDIAAGGLLELLGMESSQSESRCATLPFMDKFVLVILAIMMAQQIEQEISAVPEACSLATSSLNVACRAIKGIFLGYTIILIIFQLLTNPLPGLLSI